MIENGISGIKIARHGENGVGLYVDGKLCSSMEKFPGDMVRYRKYGPETKLMIIDGENGNDQDKPIVVRDEVTITNNEGQFKVVNKYVERGIPRDQIPEHVRLFMDW